jgi:predicted permease
VDIVNLLAPIFLLIALGAVVQRVGLLEEGVVSGLNKLLYWVGLPAAVFHSLAVAPQSEASAVGIAGTMVVGTLIMVAGSWWWARGLGVLGTARGTFTQAAFRGNLSFIGLPLLLTVPGVPTGPAVLALAPMLVLYNALAVTLTLVPPVMPFASGLVTV